ncbi:MAG: peptidoglycan-binding protein [bacterium]|nr:peptidoglycan-binding protein [bacterium]
MTYNKKIDIAGVSAHRALWTAGVALAVIVSATPLLAGAAVLTRQLEMGMNGTDVSTLQSFLAQNPITYPQGLVTGYFGFLTKSAVSNFQSQNGIESVGRVGPITLAAINNQMGNGATGGLDRSAPSITSTSVSAGRTNATINWGASELARGKVYYSTTPIRLNNTYEQTGNDFIEPTVSGSLASYDGVARTSQTVTINDLIPNTTYYYLVEVLDGSNNVSITTPSSFRTAQ